MKIYYNNPVSVNSEKAFPDPYLLKHRGRYYCYSTGKEGVHLLSTNDLIHFSYLGYALQTPGEKEYWAPCVVYSNGLFYMYYSSRQCDEEDVHKQRLKVAISESPEGPFIYKTTLRNTFCIDPDVQITSNGWVIYYATNDFSGNDLFRPGTSIVADRLLTPYLLANDAEEIIKPSRDREIFMINRFGDGRNWHTIEAPCYLHTVNNEYLMYSGNAYTSKEYFVDYAVHIKGKWIKREYTEPLLESDGNLFGTGHNSIVEGPDLNSIWTAYHGMLELPHDDTDTRKLCINKIVDNSESICFDHENCIPELPYISSIYAGLSEIFLSAFDSSSGHWVLESKYLFQEDEKIYAELISKEYFSEYIFEFWAKGEERFNGGVFGCYPQYIDKEHFCQLKIIANSREVLCVQQNGEDIVETQVLKRDIDFLEWQRFTIVSGKKNIDIRINGNSIIQLDKPFGESEIGLFTQYSKCWFDGIAVQSRFKE